MSGWYGVDLDGSQAKSGDWQGAHYIGAPIQPMVDRVKGWLADGREVRIMTARVHRLQDEKDRLKAAFYVWVARHYSLERALVIRGIVGNATLYPLMAFSIFGSRSIFLALKKFSLLPSCRAEP